VTFIIIMILNPFAGNFMSYHMQEQ